MTAPQKLHRSSCDALSLHLRRIGRIPLLTHEEEITLARAVQTLRRLEEIQEELRLRSGGQAPPLATWAAEAKLSVTELRRSRQRGQRARHRMVTANLRLVVTIARKYASRQLELEDLIQEGNIGLLKAVDRFDPARGYKFSTYAYWWIREKITRAIADKSRTIRLPIHVGEQLSKLHRAQQQLWQQLGRAPSIEELAETTGMKPLDIREILFRAQQPVSLQASSSDDPETCLMQRIRCTKSDPDLGLTRQLFKQDLEDVLLRLPAQEGELLRLRYGIDRPEPLTLSAVARSMGVTRDTARGIERRALAAVREYSNRVVDYLEA